MKRSQNAIEFILIFFMILVGFSVLVVLLNQRVVEINKERFYDSLTETADILESEINLAIKSENGYVRSFSLPKKSLFNDYNVTFKNASDLSGNYSMFSFNYTEQRIHKTNYFFFTTSNISGEVIIGDNKICKQDNYIILNECD